MGATSLCVENLSVRFGALAALSEVYLTVAAGELVLLTGPSGSGKSTLLRCANGLIPHVWPARLSGRVSVDGLDVAGCAVAELARLAGFVFQSPETQLFNLSVHDEVRFGPQYAGLPAAAVEERARWALGAVGIEHLEERRLDTLSGGEKQRVAIASVMALRPALLLLDEPTAHLDVLGARLVFQSLERLRGEEGVSVVIGEHRTGAVGRLADRMVVLEEGRKLADGPTATVFAGRDLMRRLGIRRPNDEPQQAWETLIGPPATAPGVAPLAILDGVHAGYGKREVLRGVDLELYPGEVVALVGDNGAGKTTLARVVAGLHPPGRGRVLVDGRKPRPGEGVGMVMEDPASQLFCDRVEEEVAFGPRNFDLYEARAVEEVLAACDLLSLRTRRPHALSCGQQQRTVLASVIATRPRLLILDEPTRGQDWAHLASIMDFLRRWAAEGTAILVLTHDYKLVHRYADRVVLLREGRVAATGRLHGAVTAGAAEGRNG